MCYGVCKYEDREGECTLRVELGNYPEDAFCVEEDGEEAGECEMCGTRYTGWACPSCGTPSWWRN